MSLPKSNTRNGNTKNMNFDHFSEEKHKSFKITVEQWSLKHFNRGRIIFVTQYA